MRRHLVSLWLLLVIGGTVQAAPGVAMAVSVEGQAQAGKATLQKLQALATGQELTLGPGARVVLIFFADGHQETVQGPARLKLQANGTAGAQTTSTAPLTVEEARSRADIQRYGGGQFRPAVSEFVTLTTPINLEAPLKALKFSNQGSLGPYTVTVNGPLPEGLALIGEAELPVIWTGTTDRLSGLAEEVTLAYQGPPLQADRTYYWEVTQASVRRGLRVDSPAARKRRQEALSALPGDTARAALQRMAVYLADYRLQEALTQAGLAARSGVAPALVALARGLQAELGDRGAHERPWP